jgi:ABC-type phosphate transport system substrate-binding protein
MKGLTTIPISYGGVAITFNIPSLPLDLQYATFYLNTSLLVDIWLGAITNWRDSRILELNPGFEPFLPNASKFKMRKRECVLQTMFVIQK